MILCVLELLEVRWGWEACSSSFKDGDVLETCVLAFIFEETAFSIYNISENQKTETSGPEPGGWFI